ncbi:MAG: hypothetical protein FJX11_13045 [Alphaproteobacteria bacterium]|nr:hypothetical protein [Alphaproteobacteria bacterium]
MTVDVVASDSKVIGRFRQGNRAPRRFDAVLGTYGAFATTVEYGLNGPIWVTGRIDANDGRVVLDNFKGQRCVCRFEAELARVPRRDLAAAP